MRHVAFRRIRIPAFLLGLLLLTLCTQQPLMAQSQPVTGTVLDPSGGAIPGATVTITDLNKTQVVKTITTDENGRFSALDIQPGRYEATIERPGFKKTTLSFDVDVNRQVALGKITLAVGAITETVAVSEVAPPIDTDSMDKAYLVNRHQISQLPMNGRNWIALMSTVPGMTSSAQSDFNVNFNDVSQFHGLGGRGSQNNFYLDGSPNIDVGEISRSIRSRVSIRSASSAFSRARLMLSMAGRKVLPLRCRPNLVPRASMELHTNTFATTTLTQNAFFATRFTRHSATTSSAAIWVAGCTFPSFPLLKTRKSSFSTTVK